MAADFTMLGSWDFNELYSSGIANSVTSFSAYYDPVTKKFSYGPSSGGAAFDTTFSYSTSGNWNNSGSWNYTGAVSVNSAALVTIVTTGAGNYLNFQSTDDNLYLNAPAAGMQIIGVADGITLTSNYDTVYQSTLGNLTIQANTGGRQVGIFGDAFNWVSNLDASLSSTNSNIFLTANSGNATLSSLNTGVSGVNGLALFTTNGQLLLNSANGNLNIQAGNGGTSGDLSLTSGIGNVSINAPGTGSNGSFSAANSLSFSANTGDANFNTQSGNVNIFSQSGNINLNVNSSPGSISMNAQGGNWSVSEGGVAGGTSGGAGANITVDGDFSFGSGAPAPHGQFLFGSLTNTVMILSHLGMSLVNDTNDSTFQATAGFANIKGGAGIKLIIPTLPVGDNVQLLIDHDGNIHI